MSNSASRQKIPGAGSVLSGVALYAFCRGYLYALALFIAPLFELLRGYPRLTALASLALWLAPILLIAIAHSALSSALDRFDAADAKKERGSAWVGLYSWLVALFATVTTFFVAVVIQPPPPEPDMLGQLMASMSLSGGSLAIHTAVWIVIAALLYRAEQRARRRSA
jgi:hypothetical protein